MNLLQETVEWIEQSGHKPEQIIFIGSEKTGHACTWDEFTKLANRDYDSGFGAQNVASDLIIVFSDGMKMWRVEYDGSEWWEYSTPFKMPEETKPIERLFTRGVGWDDLDEIHGENE